MIARFVLGTLTLITVLLFAVVNVSVANASAANVESNDIVIDAVAADALPKNLSQPPIVSPVFTGNSVIQVVLSLAFVIVLIYAVAWYIRRLQLTTAGTGQAMQVVSALSVGPRERVVLVQVGEEQLLLGVAPGRVNLLQQFETAVIDVKDANLQTSFAKILGKARVVKSDAV